MDLKREELGGKILIGAVSGTVATWAMTLAANALFRRLPDRERYPLPPREIIESVSESSGEQKSPDKVKAF